MMPDKGAGWPDRPSQTLRELGLRGACLWDMVHCLKHPTEGGWPSSGQSQGIKACYILGEVQIQRLSHRIEHLLYTRIGKAHYNEKKTQKPPSTPFGCPSP